MEENKNKGSFLKEIEKVKKQLETDKTQLNPHVMIMMEVDEYGMPVGFVTSVSGGPVILLGIVEMILSKLDDLREVVHNKLQSVERASKELNKNMPKELQEKLKDLELRARKAMQEDNVEEAEKIAMEVKDLLKEYLGDVPGINLNDQNLDDSESKSDFDLNDFKDM